MDQREIDNLTERALAALCDGHDVRAVAIADQLLGAVPDDPQGHAIRAQALLSSDNVDDALAGARRAVELNGENQYARRVLGLAAWRSEKLTLAQESFERAIELSGGESSPLAEYAWFMANERGPRLAEEASRRALEADEDSSTAWAALGVTQYRLHRRDEAEQSLNRALELDPQDLYARSAMATLLQDRRKDDQAEALADMLTTTPGTEEFVESIHQEAKKRKLAKMLVERNAMPEPHSDESPRRIAAWMLGATLMIVGICLLIEPRGPWMILLCVIPPLVAMLLLRRFFE